ncbi:MAG: hypothetical protein ABR521_00680 [Gaiellaceae bacterium]
MGLALALAGCGGEAARQLAPPPIDAGDARARNGRLLWLMALEQHFEQTARRVDDPALVRKVERAASASGARALDVTVLAMGEGEHGPVVTLAAADPASYMKHELRGFLEKIGYRNGFAFVELLDEHGRFAWVAGNWSAGGMVASGQSLDQCSPISHSRLVGAAPPPPCPAD